VETEVILKIIEGSSAITLLAIGVLYLLMRRRDKSNGSSFVTQKEFESTVRESRRLSEDRHTDVINALNDFADQCKEDRKNLYNHVSNHNIHGD